MPYAVELGLDGQAGAVVRRAWDELAAAGFPSMARSGARPHVSLAVWDAIDVARLDTRVRAFAAETAPLEITFDRAGSFTGGVVYLAPAPSAGLRRLHAAFHARCEDLSRSVWHHYQPDFWMPHLTLAMDLEPSQVAPALAIAETIRLPLPARLVEVGIVEFRPVRELAGYPLAGR